MLLLNLREKEILIEVAYYVHGLVAVLLTTFVGDIPLIQSSIKNMPLLDLADRVCRHGLIMLQG